MRRADCPYRWCSATIEIVPVPGYPGTGESQGELIKAHPIQSGVLTGTCPASNLRVPLEDRAAENLRQQERNDGRRIPKLVVDSVPEKPNRYRLPWVAQGPPESQSLRGDDRSGREPGPTADDWSLGGRDDEDSGKTAPPIKPPRIPPGILGQEVGRHVVSIDELIGLIKASAIKSGEALSTVQDCENQLALAGAALEEAKGMIAGAMEQHRSQTLSDEMGLLERAQEKVSSMVAQCERIKGEISHAHELGEQYIGVLLS